MINTKECSKREKKSDSRKYIITKYEILELYNSFP